MAPISGRFPFATMAEPQSQLSSCANHSKSEGTTGLAMDLKEDLTQKPIEELKINRQKTLILL